MPDDLRQSHPSLLPLPPAASTGLRPVSRGLWPGVLLGVVGVGLLALSLLALFALAGLVLGLHTFSAQSDEPAPAQPETLVLVIPGAAPDPMVMPAPAALVQAAAAPLPTPASTARPLADETTKATGQEEPTAQKHFVQSPVTYADLFRSVGAQTGIDWRLLAALAYRESRMDPLALGRDGDLGLMQILPSTWAEFAPIAAAGNPFDPRENVQVSAAYLIYLQEYVSQWQTNDLRWVLAAYNWGPDNVRRLLARGARWEEVPALQQRYVNDILQAAFGAEE